MLLTVKVKLLPDAESRRKLLMVMETFNDACNQTSKIAYETRTYNKYKLQHTIYHQLRERYNLPAQLAIRAISKVVESYKVERKHLHTFDRHGSLTYDQRVMGFKGLEAVTLTTLEGRVRVPFLFGAYAKLDQRRIRGQADLIYVRGDFYLCLVVEQPEEPQLTPEGYLGVDLGVVKLASTSDGVTYSGEDTDAVREHYTEKKAELQGVGSKGSKRKLRKIGGREARFKRDLNHRISKQLVAVAKDTKRGVALEDLRGIRARTTVRRGQRERLGKWAFNQLRQFVEYKAKIAGVPVLIVDPRYTSQRCSECGYVGERNRPSQATFRCRACGYESNADLNAAKNIQLRAEVSQPIEVCQQGWSLNLKPTPLGVGN